MSDQPEREPIIIKSLEGSSATDGGDCIKIGLVLFGGGKAKLLIPVDKAVELIGLIGSGVAEADQKRATYKADRRGWKH